MKIICVGRNYAAHAKEMGSQVPDEPVVFMKPPSALLVNDKPLYYPEFTSDLHYEAELVFRIERNGKHIQAEFASSYYSEVGFGIDFTARDLQAKMKEKRLPWEIAKGFDGSAAVSSFIPLNEFDLQNITFRLYKNDQLVQEGNSGNMIFGIDQLICHISRYFKLQMGDLIFTGTPVGVGPVQIGDKLVGYIEDRELLHCVIR